MNRRDEILNYFENIIPDYYKSNSIRQYQVQMALDVMNFFMPDNHKRLMFIEAPVGTGKTLGALIPALLERQRQNKQVLYATSTINLQGQIWSEEIPIAKKLCLVTKPILAKGKSHYFCMSEYENNRAKLKHYGNEFDKFYNTCETGQRDEFEKKHHVISDQDWNYVSLKATSYVCKNCERSMFCPTYKQRSKFKAYDIDFILTNHDQLIRSVIIDQGYTSQKPIVPVDPGIIIIDEANQFMENFMGQSQDEIDISGMRSMSKFVNPRFRSKYNKQMNHIRQIIYEETSALESIQGRYPISEKLLNCLNYLASIINESLQSDLGAELAYNRYNDYDREEPENDSLENVLTAIRKLNHEDYVSWICYDNMSLNSINRRFPTDFRNMVSSMTRHNKLLIMSGTLTNNGDFESILKQWRLKNEEVITKSLPTSFMYEKQAKMYIPLNCLNFNTSQYQDYISDQLENIKQLLSLTGGRSLILCTSKKVMDDLYQQVTAYLSAAGINCYKQDDSGVEVLTDKFKKDETSVLIGSGSFFSGFSVSGRSLVSVIITKLPFPVPDDPYLKLLGEGLEENEFFQYISFPLMMIKLHQAVGRLIRDIKDYGIVTILDSRIYNKFYGKDIKDSFEFLGYNITDSFDEVTDAYKNWTTLNNDGTLAGYFPYNKDLLEVHENLIKEIYQKQSTMLLSTIKPGKYERKRYKDFFEEDEIKRKKSTKKRKEKVIETEITEEQFQYYNNICSKYGIIPEQSKFKTSKDLFVFILTFSYRNDHMEIAQSEFPYSSDFQRETYSILKPTSCLSYRLTPEAIVKVCK